MCLSLQSITTKPITLLAPGIKDSLEIYRLSSDTVLWSVTRDAILITNQYGKYYGYVMPKQVMIEANTKGALLNKIKLL